jgi:hypothetical protein
LEEQIRKIEEENDAEEAELRDSISKLNGELDHCKGEVEWWKAKCARLEKDLEAERNARRTQMGLDETQSPQDTVPLPQRRPHRQKPVTGPEQPQVPEPDLSIGCGHCSSLSRCECIEQAFNMAIADISSNTKRPQSPQQSSDNKRVKQEEAEELETDFTAQFSSAKSQATTTSPITIADPCGFCQNGTPCICAEMAAESSGDTPNAASLSQFTPPPSEGDVLPPSMLPASEPNPCINGPGSCTQCRSDPNSTIFCKTLAASRSAPSSTNGCAAASANGTCCQTRSATANASTSSSSLRLSCADAYTTLSRHRNYARASDEMGTWLPKLHTLPALANEGQVRGGGMRSRGQSEGVDVEMMARPAMDIEAASVMGVLKYFDRRFGKGN